MTVTAHSSSTDRPLIVVGVDGSPGSKEALRWAMTHAQLIGARVEAVAAWQDPVMYGFGFGYAPTLADGGSQARVTQQALDQSIKEVSALLDEPVEVSTRVDEGNAAQILPQAATHAQMLVVGSRGHGAFAGMLLGSVSQHCVQHLTCPVVVIPTPASAE
jgi:nucleotide-binding universal stress UspA family protein